MIDSRLLKDLDNDVRVPQFDDGCHRRSSVINRLSCLTNIRLDRFVCSEYFASQAQLAQRPNRARVSCDTHIGGLLIIRIVRFVGGNMNAQQPLTRFGLV